MSARGAARAGIALALACGCAGPRSPRASAPIAADLLCAARAPSAVPGDGAATPTASCAAALAPRLEALRRGISERWLPPSHYQPGEVAQVQLQFELGADGRPAETCVLGGTGDAEARAALQALAKYSSEGPLSEAERCVLGQPLISTFSSEVAAPAR
jgi:hypothetical protein